MKKNPSIKISDIGKQSGEEWKKLTDSQKQKYEKLNLQDKSRYQKEMKEFEKTGFFTNSDGVNSKYLSKTHRVIEFPKDTVMPK